MSDLPGGTLTFLFTDIEGSTRLWEQHPAAMRTALARHDEILRARIEHHHGQVFKTVGDAFYAVFTSPHDALQAAVEAQRALAAEAWELPEDVRVRMALHVDTAHPRHNDYFGPGLSRVARLLSAAHGGQILASAALHALTVHTLPAEFRFADQGRHRLKDLAYPEHIHQVEAPGLPSQFPPVRTLDTLPNNLPRQLTSFIGREHELADLRALIGQTLLLTLTGPGGTGKTRLALQIAAEQIEAFADGVWLVELASLADPALVGRTVAGVLGIPETSRPVGETIADHLRPRQVLLILDNCEHLLAACADLIAGLLQAAPQVRVLATSQQVFGIPGERVYRVPPLSLPDPGAVPPLERLTEFEAVRLFVERATFSAPAFRITPQNAAAILQICRRLEGIPLALELAAARTKALALEEIARRLDQQYQVLSTGGRMGLARHQTLRAAMDWSHGLLSEPEQVLFRRLAGFPAGFTLETIEAVCCDERLPREAILDLLAGLVDKSLVIFIEGEGAGRYRLLEPILQYSRERLAASDDVAALHHRLYEYWLDVAEAAESGDLIGAAFDAWLDRIEAEQGNLRYAMEWALRGDRPGAAVRLAAALWQFWAHRGHLQEGRALLEQALEAGRGDHSPSRATALNAAGFMAFRQDDYDRGIAYCRQSLEISQPLDDADSAAFSLALLGHSYWHRGEIDRAIPHCEEGLAAARRAARRRSVLTTLREYTYVAWHMEDYPRLETVGQEYLAVAREIGDRSGIADSLRLLGESALHRGALARAAELYQESLAVSSAQRDALAVALAQISLGNALLAQGKAADAEALFRASVPALLSMGDRWWLARGLESVARLDAGRGRHARAAKLLGAASALRRSIGAALPPADQPACDEAIARARSGLGNDAYEAAFAAGSAMSLEEAAGLATADS